MSFVLVNTFNAAILVGYTYGYHASIGICHGYNSVGESLRFYMNALAVESLPFGHLTYIFDCISHIKSAILQLFVVFAAKLLLLTVYSNLKVYHP